MTDRQEIFDSIAPDNPRAAIRMDDRIIAYAALLKRFPHIGRRGRIRGTRELVMSNSPYVAAYAVTETEVKILRVLHGRRYWPERF